MSKKVSIIIPVWNGRRFLSGCLDALLHQTSSEAEIIAVDNASVDGAADFVVESYPQVRLIRNKYNLGFAGACNVGIRKSTGDILVLLNQDTRVRADWLQVLQAAFQQPEMGVAGCKILYPDGETIQHAGAWIEWSLGLAHHHGQGEQDTGQWDTPRQVEYVTGAALAFRRDVLDQVGVLDEGFHPGYFEDADFCFRAREAGYEIHYVPSAILEHEETTSLVDSASISQAYQRGRLRFVLKHLSPERFLSEFVSAEKSYQPAAIRGKESAPLRMAYLETITTAVPLLRQRWQADEETVRQVLVALQELYHLAWEEDWTKSEEMVAGIASSLSLSMTEPLSLDLLREQLMTEVGRPPSLGIEEISTPVEEFEFRSTVPIIGPLIARFRSLWYNVAARWAVRYLAQQLTQQWVQQWTQIVQQWTQQQELHIRSLAYIHFLAKRIETLSAENVLLAQGIANLLSHQDDGESTDELGDS